MKKLFLFILSLAAGTLLSAQSPALLAPAAGAALGAFFAKDRSTGTQIAASAGGALVGYFGGKMLEERAAKEKYKMYQIGRYHEAWVRAQTDWYHSTNDRKSGLPTAFDGYWAMYIGLPQAERAMAEQRAKLPAQFVPADREGYIEYLLSQSQVSTAGTGGNAQASNTGIVVPTTTAIMPARTIEGIDYRPSKRDFPTLP